MKKVSGKDMELFREKMLQASSILGEAVDIIGCDTFVRGVYKSASGEMWDLTFEKR